MVQQASRIDIGAIVQRQRDFFRSGQTQPLDFRLQQLQKLQQAIADSKAEILAALQADLGKPEFEAYATEIGVLREFDYVLRRLRKWTKPQRVSVGFEQFPARAEIRPEPLGVVLIVGPWNYPFQLLIWPLVGAIAAGNCILLKPSELAPHTSAFVAKLIGQLFDPAYITVVEGGVETSQAILEERFDHIFFTGGTAIGKIVMSAAAKHLTPVTLELGGKSPCIVDADVQVEYAAKRIVWGKFLNCGQTCIAPDYLLVDRRVKPALLAAIQTAIREFYGDDPAKSPDYGRIVSDRHFDRLAALLDGDIITGGQIDRANRYIAPTVIDRVTWNDAVMQDEIFGPILPILAYDDLDEAIAWVSDRPKPLALYFFSRNADFQQRILNQTSSGSVCINDTVMQVGIPDLPFGGVGASGMGRYHGKASFDTFTHFKSVLVKSFRLDLKWRYPPYADKLDFLKRIIG
ncbi:aldehyde dehydrogenase [Microcoleus sp. FACHB-1515]|uniref:aldehyde dehydrogenase n=1 Tax=Cyanophyceae TaxID=3028117 RepID=UPI001684CE96|nr:aldehyde dehydrogenase [Microcoleus sp. FACHB-1515]MBD2092667.1 aldehyde dehydrogenase [Microcoleus sp. FACHB-1515]